MNEYNRKTVANILSIPTETIRYFEKIGVVKPRIDPKNQYRYFSDSDILRIFMYKNYKSFGFTQEQALTLSGSGNTEDIATGLNNLENQLHNKIAYYQKMALYISSLQTWIEDIPRLENNIIEDELPSYAYFTMRKNNEFILNSEKVEDISTWIQNLPFVTFYTEYPLLELKNRDPSIEVGLSFFEKNATYVDLDYHKQQHVESQRAYHTVVACPQDGTYPVDSFGWIKDWVDKNQIKSDKIIVFQTLNFMKDNQPFSYYDVYIPF